MKLAEAKRRLTIHELWRHFRFEGEPSKSCRCPFHEDRSASFSVSPDGALFTCFAGCGGGDAVDFYQLASGLSHGEACRKFIALAGGGSVRCPPVKPRVCKPADDEAEKARRRALWPALESPVTGEDDTPARALAALAKLRDVSVAGARLMAERGSLYFAEWKQLPAWIVTDSARLNAQARRMDGREWEGIGKAQTWPGSQASWPVGVRESQPFGVVLLCEGGPDLLSAHHFIALHRRAADSGAVAILGASNTIPAEALPLFAGKRVRVMPHTDKAGRRAAVKWAKQLETVACDVDAADFTGLLMDDGKPVKDLNDLCRIHPDHENELQDLIPE